MAKNMRHLLIILEHCDFAYFFENYPQKSNFYASKKKLLITTVGWKVEKYKFQFMKEVVKFLFPVWPAVSKAFYKALKRWEEQRSSSSLFNVERSLSPFLAESLECLTLIAFKIDAKKVEPAPLQREIEPLQN